MTHLLIKSFNRPYYLDRCLQSAYRYVKGDFKIIVLDDGTPEKYLNKIQENFPQVEIRKSEQYEQKSKAIQENLESGKEIDGFKIPTDLWYTAVQNASDYVLVTEDDVWFTQEINLTELVKSMNECKIDLLKLGWLGNKEFSRATELKSINSGIYAEKLDDIFSSNSLVMDILLNNRFKIFSLLYRIGKVDNMSLRKYWRLNSILMGLWNKDYWLYVWKDINGMVDEKSQLINSAVWLHKNKENENLIALTDKNYLRTTFQSSATNSYHKYGFKFDVNYFNHLMNEAWYKGEFDSMENFSKDFSMNYFEQFLDEKIDKNEFNQWVEKFKNQYRNNGILID